MTFPHRLAFVVPLCILGAFITMQARPAEDADGFTDTQMSCMQESYNDYVVRGLSDIDVMERCKIVTSKQILFALNFIMNLRVHEEPIGTTPFQEAHCQTFYAGYECEYKGITMQMVSSRQLR